MHSNMYIKLHNNYIHGNMLVLFILKLISDIYILNYMCAYMFINMTISEQGAFVPKLMHKIRK